MSTQTTGFTALAKKIPMLCCYQKNILKDSHCNSKIVLFVEYYKIFLLLLLSGTSTAAVRFIVHKSTKVMWIRISLFSFDNIVCSDSLMQIHIKILIIRQGSIKCPCFFSNQQQLQLLFIIIFYLLIHLQLWKTIIHIVLGIKKSLVCKPSLRKKREYYSTYYV